MKYDPNAKQDAILPPGEYDATVVAAEERQSKSGNDMIELKLAVYDKDGTEYPVDDYLVSSPRALWKLEKFCESAGLVFGAGELTAIQTEGCNVRVNIGVEKRQGFRDQNKVWDYLPKNGTTTRPVAPPIAAEYQDEDLGFGT